jgi:hypothetical protein
MVVQGRILQSTLAILIIGGAAAFLRTDGSLERETRELRERLS